MMNDFSPGEPVWTHLLFRSAAERARTRVHLVGIGGSGLSAAVAPGTGFAVSGSDQRPNEATDELARRGVRIFADIRDPGCGSDLVPSPPPFQKQRRSWLPMLRDAVLGARFWAPGWGSARNRHRWHSRQDRNHRDDRCCADARHGPTSSLVPNLGPAEGMIRPLPRGWGGCD
jgi:hypothetical protein